MDFNGSLWVLITLFSTFWILMGPNKSLRDLMNAYGSLWILIVFLCVLMGLFESLNVPMRRYVSFWVFIGL